jgi:hypothetical protein
MALSWQNLPFALTAAIGIGKQTLGRLASLACATGVPQQGPGRLILSAGNLREPDGRLSD